MLVNPRARDGDLQATGNSFLPANFNAVVLQESNEPRGLDFFVFYDNAR